MGEPFTLKDMEATGDVARSLEQYVEKQVTKIIGEVLASLTDESKNNLNYTYEEWNRFSTVFMFDEDVIDDFNRLIILAKEKGIDLNKDLIFKKKFLKYLRPQYEKKKKGYAQIIQLAGMGNLEPPKKRAEDYIKRRRIGEVDLD